MKKLFLILILFIGININAQTNVGMGVTSSLKAISLDLQMDFQDKVGFQIGASIPYKYGFIGEKYTTINPSSYTNNIYQTGETVDLVPYIGMYFKKDKTSIGLKTGAIIYTGYQNRYDNHNILGLDGYYYVKTKSKNTTDLLIGFTISQQVFNKFYLQGGYDNYNKASFGIRIDF